MAHVQFMPMSYLDFTAVHVQAISSCMSSYVSTVVSMGLQFWVYNTFLPSSVLVQQYLLVASMFGASPAAAMGSWWEKEKELPS